MDFDTVKELLLDAIKNGLDVEVVGYALNEMKQNPTLTVAEAMNIGYNEWVK